MKKLLFALAALALHAHAANPVTVMADPTTAEYKGPKTLAAFIAANNLSSLPNQAGHAGAALMTDGAILSWGVFTISPSSVTSAMIVDGTIVNADIAPGAAIANSKIAGLAASATMDTTNAANITSGILDDARLSANVALVSTYNPMNRNASISANRTWSTNGHIFIIGGCQFQDNSFSTSGGDFTTDAGNFDLSGGHITSVGNGGITFSGTGAADTAVNLNGFVVTLANPQTITGVKKWAYHTFILKGAITGEITVDVPDNAGTNSITFPAETGTLALRETANAFSATGNAFTGGLGVTTSDAGGFGLIVSGDGPTSIQGGSVVILKPQYLYLRAFQDATIAPTGTLYIDTAVAMDVDAAVPVTVHGNFSVGGTLSLPAGSVTRAMLAGDTQQVAFVTKTANYSATISDYTIYIDATAANVQITLPTPATSASGGYSYQFRIKRIDASAHTGTIIVSGGANMDTYSSLSLAPYQSVDLQSNATKYFIH